MDLTDMEEDLKSLLKKAQDGNLEAFTRIVRQFQDMAVGYAYSILGDLHLFTTRRECIGLGLPVCRTIIQQHQGTIEVESQVGKGTTSIVNLPAGYGSFLNHMPAVNV